MSYISNLLVVQCILTLSLNEHLLWIIAEIIMSTEKSKKITPTKLKLKGLKFYFAPSIEKKLLDKMSNALLKCGSVSWFGFKNL